MRNRSVAVAVVVALLATAGWWFGLYNPKTDQLAAVEVEIDDLLSRQQQLRNEITQLRQVEADQEEIRAALERLLDYIPEGTAEPEVVRQLQASADSAGVEITSLTLGDAAPLVEAPVGPSPEVTLAEIPVTMVLKGTYFQVVDFLRRLEVDGSRAVLVESISMAEAEDGFPQLQATWSGQMFAEVPVVLPGAPGASAAPAPPAMQGPSDPGATDTTTTPAEPAPDAATQAAAGTTANGGQG